MKKENIQIEMAVRLLLEYLLEQRENLMAAIVAQHFEGNGDKSTQISKTRCHSTSSSDSTCSSCVPGSSNTMS